MTYDVLPLVDRAVIRAFLNEDRSMSAYALGDLDDSFWPMSSFYGAVCAGKLVSVVLFYHGFDPAILLTFGDLDGVRAIYMQMTLPHEIYYVLGEEQGGPLSELYDCPERHHEWRMVLDAGEFAAPSLDGAARIEPGQADLLAALYHKAAGPNEEIVSFSPWQIAHGMFYGIWQDGALVATAGTHVWSAAEGVAAIGNVFTQPEFRGRGYATVCTAAVTREAIAAGLDTVVLNVRQDNAPAIRVYEKLGFRRYHLCIEGSGWLRPSS